MTTGYFTDHEDNHDREPYSLQIPDDGEAYRARIVQDSPEAYNLGWNDGLIQGVRYNSIPARFHRLKWRLENKIPYPIRQRFWRLRKRLDTDFDGIPF